MHQLAFKGSLVCASQNQLTPTLTDKLKGPSNQEQKSKDTEAQGLRSRPGRRKLCPKLLIFPSCLSCRQPRPESTLDASPYEGDTTPLLEEGVRVCSPLALRFGGVAWGGMCHKQTLLKVKGKH